MRAQGRSCLEGVRFGGGGWHMLEVWITDPAVKPDLAKPGRKVKPGLAKPGCHNTSLLVFAIGHFRPSQKPPLGVFLAGSTDLITNNVQSAVPYLKSLSNSVLAKVLVRLLSVIITTGGVILQRNTQFQKATHLGLICPPPWCTVPLYTQLPV